MLFVPNKTLKFPCVQPENTNCIIGDKKECTKILTLIAETIVVNVLVKVLPQVKIMESVHLEDVLMFLLLKIFGLLNEVKWNNSDEIVMPKAI